MVKLRVNERTWKGGLSLEDEALRTPPRFVNRDCCKADPGPQRGVDAPQEAAVGATGCSAAREGRGAAAAVAERVAREGSGEASPANVRTVKDFRVSRTLFWRRARAFVTPARDMFEIAGSQGRCSRSLFNSQEL